eukprot:g24198.t1
MSLVLQEGDDNQEADDDNSNFDNDDNHDNNQAKTDDELKHVFKEIKEGLDVLFEKLRLVPYNTREKWKHALYLKWQDGLFKHETNMCTLLLKRPKLNRVLDADTQRLSHSSSSSSCLPSSPNLPDPRLSLDFAPSVSHVQPAGFPPQFLGPKHLPSHSHFPSVSYVQPAIFPPQLFVPLHLPNHSLFPLASRVQHTGFQPQRPGPNHLPESFPSFFQRQSTDMNSIKHLTFPADHFSAKHPRRNQRKPNQSLFYALSEAEPNNQPDI